MNIYGIGTDIVNIKRISRAIKKNKSFKNRIFTKLEISTCEKRINMMQCFAKRFAAKEALFKAIGIPNKLRFNDIEIKNNISGSPRFIIKGDSLKNLKKIPIPLITYENFAPVQNSVYFTLLEDVNIYLIEPQGEKKYFERGKIYGETDDIERFLHLCFASLQFLLEQKQQIDILHLHDWITAACAPLYKERFQSLGLSVGKVITTIHNMCYQGLTKGTAFRQMGLSLKNLLNSEKMQDHKKNHLYQDMYLDPRHLGLL